jgi:hypothetical protein
MTMLPLVLVLAVAAPVATTPDTPSPTPAPAIEAQAAPEAPPAQAPPAPPAAPKALRAAPEAQPAPEPRRSGQPVNVRIDVTINDERPGRAALAKSVSLTLADQESGNIRSATEAPLNASGSPELRTVSLDLDARPSVDGGKVKLMLALEYNFLDTSASGRFPTVGVRERMTVLLESGKPLLVSQSADPTSDRRVTLELKATILR